MAGFPSLAQLLAKGTATQPPSTGPKAAKGKTIWWVSLGMSIPSGAVPAKAAEEAAKTMGINFHIADGKLNAGGGFLAALNTALAAKPDAIILHAIDCSAVKAALRKARAAHVPVIGLNGAACADDSGGAPLLQPTQYSAAAPAVADYFRAWGKQSADYIIAASGGHAQVLANLGTDSAAAIVSQGFVDEMKKCSGCTSESVSWSQADLTPGGPWVQRLRPALVAHPKTDWVWLPFSPNIGLGVPIVRQILPHAKIVGGTGEAADQHFVSSGQVEAMTGAQDAQWYGYAAMDEANRAIQGQPLVPEGIGVNIETKTVNVPPAGSGFVSNVKWKQAYQQLWGGQ